MNGECMKVGHGNAHLLADLAMGVPDGEMRERWKRGEYGKPRTEYVAGWRDMAGRKPK